MKTIFNRRCIFTVIGAMTVILTIFFVFFCKQGTYYTMLSVRLERYGLPYVHVSIEGNPYPMVIDLGSRLELQIYDDILERFHKHPYNTEKWKNFRGTAFQHQAYTLPKINIGSLTFKKPVAVGTPLEEEEAYVIWGDCKKTTPLPETIGYLGRGLLEKTNLLFDIKQSKIFITNNLCKLKNDGYDVKTFLKVPFILDPRGILLEVETDLGKGKLLLDTGFTCTMIRDSRYPKNMEKKTDDRGLCFLTSRKFILSEIDFGNNNLYFIDMAEELKDVDGILGMDFIKKHVMYIDFSNRVLYIQQP